MNQDVLNGTLHESTEWLPERYNLQTKNLYKAYWTDFPEHYQNTLMQELSQAVIIHYCGRHKPWNYRYSGGPYHSLWEHYRRLSPYKCCRVRRPIGKYLKRRTKDLLFPSKREKRLAATWQITV
jgi:lipopolysaccharide biosynthesis glycosyltransferase